MTVELDMSDILGRMKAGTGKAGRERKAHPLHPDAQGMELQDRYNRAQVKADLKPGDLCREKAGMGVLAHSPVMVLWRWLDTDDQQDSWIVKDWVENHHTNRIDCLVGYLSDDGRDMVIMPHESWRLERLGDVEKTEG
jgi:hypothetical protein